LRVGLVSDRPPSSIMALFRRTRTLVV
jgi:hypothetical protein